MQYHKIAAGILLAVGVVSAQAGEFRSAANQEKKIQGQYIVAFKDSSINEAMKANRSSKAQSIKTMADQLGLKYLARVDRTYHKVLAGGVFSMSEKDAKRLVNDPNILFITEDEVVSINAVQNNPTWSLDRIDQRGLPLDNSYSYNTLASNVSAYIIDTGVFVGHPEFEGRAFSGPDFIDNDNDSDDCHGHGTHVAGTVASSTYGVAKQANIYGVRVMSCVGSGSISGIISGIDWVAQNHVKPAVANISIGSSVNSTFNNAVASLVSSGVVTAVSAGNRNDDACNQSPASEPTAITVASTTSSDARSSFSNFGSCVDIFAPGSDITSTWLGGGINTISGTSMAAPHIAGIAALYLASNPSATPSQVEQAIKNSATTGVVSDAQGSPNLLAYSIVDGTPPPAPSIELTTSVDSKGPNDTITLNWSGATSNSVDIYRNGVLIDTTSNNGSWKERLRRVSGSFSYQICEQGNTLSCSASVIVNL